ncbi:unnamed protein product [Rotaria sordida]|uniref:Uncharacterized protein n=1 Tax=Rotaria sordida TaxID=392033 RepID=A0A819KQX2_9BILA|nr:unnamed protein product [Rotaria sordida]CAF3950241.1 unnamed protein product [Rotaria sordida]
MGMFSRPSTPGESILAMCTDATNRHLICCDTRDEIRYLLPIIFCECTDYKGDGSFILTGSTDHTEHLWTINRGEIRIFGQRQKRDIELLLSSKETK